MGACLPKPERHLARCANSSEEVSTSSFPAFSARANRKITHQSSNAAPADDLRSASSANVLATQAASHDAHATSRGPIAVTLRLGPAPEDQQLSVEVSDNHPEAGIDPSVGSVGDAYDNALAEAVIGRFKTELIKPRGPWRTVEQVEIATLEYVDWFNHSRLYEACGDIPPNRTRSRPLPPTRQPHRPGVHQRLRTRRGASHGCHGQVLGAYVTPRTKSAPTHTVMQAIVAR
jgi:hypothetical protein